MKESIGYTVTLNIVITFIIIVFAFLSAALIYFKSNKASNIITETIEKYEGYNKIAENEIQAKLTSLGYNKKPVDCNKYYKQLGTLLDPNSNSDLKNGECYNKYSSTGKYGYCVFYCIEEDSVTGDMYYFYKITTNMLINIPIINDILDIPIFSNTNRLYSFDENR